MTDPPLADEEAQTADLLRGLRKKDWVITFHTGPEIQPDAFMPERGSQVSLNFHDASGVGERRLREAADVSRFGIARLPRNKYEDARQLNSRIPELSREIGGEPHDRHVNLQWELGLEQKQYRQTAAWLSALSLVHWTP